MPSGWNEVLNATLGLHKRCWKIQFANSPRKKEFVQGNYSTHCHSPPIRSSFDSYYSTPPVFKPVHRLANSSIHSIPNSNNSDGLSYVSSQGAKPREQSTHYYSRSSLPTMRSISSPNISQKSNRMGNFRYLQPTPNRNTVDMHDLPQNKYSRTSFNHPMTTKSLHNRNVDIQRSFPRKRNCTQDRRVVIQSQDNSDYQQNSQSYGVELGSLRHKKVKSRSVINEKCREDVAGTSPTEQSNSISSKAQNCTLQDNADSDSTCVYSSTCSCELCNVVRSTRKNLASERATAVEMNHISDDNNDSTTNDGPLGHSTGDGIALSDLFDPDCPQPKSSSKISESKIVVHDPEIPTAKDNRRKYVAAPNDENTAESLTVEQQSIDNFLGNSHTTEALNICEQIRTDSRNESELTLLPDVAETNNSAINDTPLVNCTGILISDNSTSLHKMDCCLDSSSVCRISTAREKLMPPVVVAENEIQKVGRSIRWQLDTFRMKQAHLFSDNNRQYQFTNTVIAKELIIYVGNTQQDTIDCRERPNDVIILDRSFNNLHAANLSHFAPVFIPTARIADESDSFCSELYANNSTDVGETGTGSLHAIWTSSPAVSGKEMLDIDKQKEQEDCYFYDHDTIDLADTTPATKTKRSSDLKCRQRRRNISRKVAKANHFCRPKKHRKVHFEIDKIKDNGNYQYW